MPNNVFTTITITHLFPFFNTFFDISVNLDSVCKAFFKQIDFKNILYGQIVLPYTLITIPQKLRKTKKRTAKAIRSINPLEIANSTTTCHITYSIYLVIFQR